MPYPSVSVVIPCFNHGRFIAEAVRSALAQVNASVKVIVVDDGSDDGSTPAACDEVARLAPERVVVIHQPNLGLSAARNRGAAEARKRGVDWAGEYLTFLDADDFLDPTFVSKLHRAIEDAETRHESGPHNGTQNGAHADTDQPPLGSVSHAYCQERLIGLADMTWAVPDWDPMLMLVTNLHPVTTLVRRECFEAVGGFDESMRGGYEDWDLWLKFVEQGWRGVRVREPLFTWRRHSPTTMIVEAGQHHGRLFGQLVRNHPDLYRRHADELHVLANTLLRRGECNWLDESGEAIVQRDLRRHIGELIHARDQNAQAASAAAAEAAALSHSLQVEHAALTERENSLAAERQRASRLEQELDAAREHDAAIARELEASRAALVTTEAALASTEAAVAAAHQRIAEAHAHAHHLQQTFEAKPVVRLSKAIHRILDHMPRPVKGLVRGAVTSAAKAAAPTTAPTPRQ